jgi:hypothetical protein
MAAARITHAASEAYTLAKIAVKRDAPRCPPLGLKELFALELLGKLIQAGQDHPEAIRT